ncbi:MAG: signal integration modulator SinM [Myxococcaceae bacterium]
MTFRFLLPVVTLLTCAGCGCGPPPVIVPDAGPDAGATAEDAGTGGDGGVDLDSCDGGFVGPGTVAASGLNLPRRLAFDGTELFISEGGALTTADGQVLRLGADGGVSPLASGFTGPDGIAADEAAVYVLDDEGLWRIEKSDGTKQAIDPGLAYITANRTGDTEVRAGGGRVVVSTGRQGLVSELADGGSRAVLYDGIPGSVVRGAVIDGSTVYFLVNSNTDRGLFRVPVDGSAAASLVSAEAGDGRSLAVTPTAFIWTEGSGGSGRVMLLERSLAAAPVVLASGLSAPARPVVAGKFVYFKDLTTTGASELFFRKVPLCAPGAAEAVGPVGHGLGDVLFDGARLWFSSARSAPDGTVGRLP